MTATFSTWKGLPNLSSWDGWHRMTSNSNSNNLVTCTTVGTVSLVLLLVSTNKQIYQRILFPGVVPDRKYKNTHSLPPGEISGCPYIGSVAIFSNMNKWLSGQSHKISTSASSPLAIFKSYILFRPAAIIVGTSRARKVLNQEFSSPSSGSGESGISQPVAFMGNALEIFGKSSLSFEVKDKSKYRFLKSLVGQAMTHEAVAKSIPALQAATEFVIREKILTSLDVNENPNSVRMEQHLRYMTLDVAWRQILGLELSTDEEIEEFHNNVAIWLGALQSSATFFYDMMPMVLLRRTRVYRAKEYLTTKIMDKIRKLEERGNSDGSTVGAMLFTRDEDDPEKRLTKEQVIDNSLLLIAAGSETTANTLTNAMLLLGLHPDVYQKLVEEQTSLIAAKGETLTKDMLDKDCPYLEGTIKEVMRILPVAGGPLRQVKSTLTIEDMQIPRNWWVMPSIYVTHENDPVTRIDDDCSHMDLVKGFKPQRWLDKKMRPKEYMPWGASYRFCAGHILAMAEMKTFLAVFCREVNEFDLVNKIDPNNIKWKFSAVSTPKDGVLISMK